MQTSTVRAFRDRATQLLKAKEPIMITRRGKIVGFFLPLQDDALPLEVKRELFYSLTQEIRRAMREKGVSEKIILNEFEKARKARRRR